jgi:O-antigen/teichoic acid export membrane protein
VQTKVVIVSTVALAVSSGLNFVALMLWTHLLSPAAFGHYALLMASVLFINATAFEWLRQTSARVLVDPESKSAVSSERANAMVAIYCAVSALFIFVIVALWLYGFWISGMDPVWWLMIGAIVLSEMALAFVNTISRIRVLPWQFFGAVLSRAVLSILIGTFLVTLGWGSEGVAIGILTAQAGVVIGCFFLDPFWRTLRPFSASRDQIYSLLALGYPLIVSSMLNYGSNIAERLIVSTQLSLEAVGYYSVAVDLLQKTLVFLLLAVNLVAYPAIVRAFEAEGTRAARKALEDNFVLQLSLGLPAILGLGILAPGISGLLLGPIYRQQAIELLPIVGASALLSCLVSFHFATALQLMKRMSSMIVPPAMNILLLIPAGFGGIYLWGLKGLAVGALFADVVSFTVTMHLARRAFPFDVVNREVLKIIASSGVMAICIAPLRYHDEPSVTVLAIVWGCFVYCLMLLLLRVKMLEVVSTRIRALLPSP